VLNLVRKLANTYLGISLMEARFIKNIIRYKKQGSPLRQQGMDGIYMLIPKETSQDITKDAQYSGHTTGKAAI